MCLLGDDAPSWYAKNNVPCTIAKNVCKIIILLARFRTILKAKQGRRVSMNTRLSVLLQFILICLKKKTLTLRWPSVCLTPEYFLSRRQTAIWVIKGPEWTTNDTKYLNGHLKVSPRSRKILNLQPASEQFVDRENISTEAEHKITFFKSITDRCDWCVWSSRTASIAKQREDSKIDARW